MWIRGNALAAAALLSFLSTGAVQAQHSTHTQMMMMQQHQMMNQMDMMQRSQTLQAMARVREAQEARRAKQARAKCQGSAQEPAARSARLLLASPRRRPKRSELDAGQAAGKRKQPE